MIQDINDLRYQQEELKKALSGNPSEDEDGNAVKEDAVILKIALTLVKVFHFIFDWASIFNIIYVLQCTSTHEFN